MISLFCLKEWRLDESGVDSARACSDNSLLIRSQSPGANEAQPFGKQLRLRSSGRRRQEQTNDGAEMPGGIYPWTSFFLFFFSENRCIWERSDCFYMMKLTYKYSVLLLYDKTNLRQL